jgi:hypothetical protein
MKLTSLIATTIVSGSMAISLASLPTFNPNSFQASAQSMSESQSESQGKIDQILAVKGKPGSGDLLRKLYEKDLTPIGIQAGGAGMVVNLYSKKDKTTLSLCTTYDVVVAARKGRIAKFKASEVK